MASPYDPWRNAYGLPSPEDDVINPPNTPFNRAMEHRRPKALYEEILPEAVTQSSLFQALQNYMAQPGGSERGMRDAIPSLRMDPIERIAKGYSTVASEYGEPGPLAKWFNKSDAHRDLGTGLNMLANFVGPAVKLPPVAPPKPQGIRAYHGSPHDFDTFQTPAFFTRNEAHAKQFKLGGASGESLNGLGASADGLDYFYAAQAMERAKGDKVKAIADLESRALQQLHQTRVTGLPDIPSDGGRLYNIAADRIRAGDPTGVMYEVSVPPPTKEYRGYDTQAKVIAEAKRDGHKVISLKTGIGDEIVALDPSVITILRKYGLLPPAALAAAGAADRQEPMQ